MNKPIQQIFIAMFVCAGTGFAGAAEPPDDTGTASWTIVRTPARECLPWQRCVAFGQTAERRVPAIAEDPDAGQTWNQARIYTGQCAPWPRCLAGDLDGNTQPLPESFAERVRTGFVNDPCAMAGACVTNDVSTASRELPASPSASAPGSAGPILFDVL